MNQRQANIFTARVLASEMEHHIENGSDWLDRLDEADQERVKKAIYSFASGMRRRADRLEKNAKGKRA